MHYPELGAAQPRGRCVTSRRRGELLAGKCVEDGNMIGFKKKVPIGDVHRAEQSNDDGNCGQGRLKRDGENDVVQATIL